MDSKKLRELELIVFDLDFQAVDASRVDPPRPMTATKMRKLVETAWKESLANDRSQNFKAQVFNGRIEFESQELYEQFIGERSQNVVENAVVELIQTGNAVLVVHAIIAHLCDIVRVSRFHCAPKIAPALHAMAEVLFARHLDVLLWELSGLSQRFQLPLKRAKLRDVCLNFFANPGSKAAQAKMRFVIEKIRSWRRRMVARKDNVKAYTSDLSGGTVQQDQKAEAKTSGLPTLYYECNGRNSKLHDGKGNSLALGQIYIENLLEFVDRSSGVPLNFRQAEELCAAWRRPFRKRLRRGLKIKKNGETAATVVKKILNKIKIGLSKQMPGTRLRISSIFTDLLAKELTDHGEDCRHKLRFNLLPFSAPPVGAGVKKGKSAV